MNFDARGGKSGVVLAGRRNERSNAGSPMLARTVSPNASSLNYEVLRADLNTD